MAAIGIDVAEAADNQLVEIYLSQPIAASISPNPYFDEQWYRFANADVLEAVQEGNVYSGFTHYLTFGLFEGRWPNPVLQSLAVHDADIPPAADQIDASFYLSTYSAARLFIRHFPDLTPLQHYNLFGRHMGFRLPAVSPVSPTVEANLFERIASEFDAEYYRQRYLSDGESRLFFNDPFSHYLVYGIPQAYSPNANFDESWYRAFYGEVRTAISRGEIVSGFYHYIAAGQKEGRLPRFDLKLALEARIPGVTRPGLMHRIPDIRARLGQRKLVVTSASPPRVWFLIPTINPDITFGGYRSAFELISAMHGSGYAVGLICTEDASADKEYFLWREKSEKFRKLINEIPFVNQANEPHLEIGLHDTVVVYSVWDMYLAEHLRKSAPELRVILLTQEYEPIFHDSCSIRAIVEEAYNIPHFPLINSAILCRYLKAHNVGVFGNASGALEGKDYAVFEHRINILPSQQAEVMRERTERVLVAYARPEGHAARNMFEILILALQQICEEGLFGPEWSFVGLGALTEIESLPLGNNHKLVMRPKMSEEEYTRCIACMDIGVSLMFAPHPSVMPFEFATTGALVVTNTYENRSAADLANICPNIIAGRPSVDGIAAALREALRLVPDVDSRVHNTYRPNNTTWETIFDAGLLETVFGPSPAGA